MDTRTTCKQSQYNVALIPWVVLGKEPLRHHPTVDCGHEDAGMLSSHIYVPVVTEQPCCPWWWNVKLQLYKPTNFSYVSEFPGASGSVNKGCWARRLCSIDSFSCSWKWRKCVLERNEHTKALRHRLHEAATGWPVLITEAGRCIAAWPDVLTGCRVLVRVHTTGAVRLRKVTQFISTLMSNGPDELSVPPYDHLTEYM